MNSSIRGWMLSLTLPAILAGSARAQAAPKAGENNVPTVERLTQDDAKKVGAALVDPFNPKAGNFRVHSYGADDLRVANDWAAPLQQYIRWPAQAANNDVGADLTSVDASLRAQLNLPQGQGLVVTNVAPEGRAARVGLKVNDILLTLGGTSLNQPIDFLNILKEKTTGAHGNESVELTYLRGGKPASVKIKAEVRVALAAAAEEKPSYYIGVPSNPLDETFRAHLSIPAGTGLVVGQIDEGTPAAKAGVKFGDILLAFGGEPLPDEDALRAKIQAKGPHPAKVEVLRAGKPMMLTVTPEPRKADATAEWVLQALSDIHDANRERTAQGVPVLQNTRTISSTINGLYTPILDQQQQNQGVLFLGAPQPAPADLSRKIDELTAQVQALAKAVEGLKATQVEKK